MRRTKNPSATWTGQAIAPTPGGGLVLRIQIPRRGWLPAFTIAVQLTPDQAGVVHAQLDRLMTKGWAMTDRQRDARQRGASAYPLVLGASLDQVGHTPTRTTQHEPPEDPHA